MTAVVEIAVAHRLGSFALDVAFASSGRLTALFGRSGAGKTSLVNMISGSLKPDEGRIVVDGKVLVDTRAGIFVPKHRRRIGYVFQEARLFPHLTVRQNLLFGRWFAPRDGGATVSLETVTALLGIGPLLQRRPAHLSGGEKQRVAIGRALLSNPRLLLMDEPLAALDEARKTEILPYVERLRDETGIPVVYVTHSVAEVARLATTLALLERGRLVACGPTAEIMARLDVARMAGAESGALLEGTVAGHDPALALTTIATAAGSLQVPLLNLDAGSPVRLRILSSDVMLSLQPLSGISALNVLPGIVAELGDRQAGAAARDVRLYCGGAALLARVTEKSVQALGLAAGCRIHAVVKSVALDGTAGGAVNRDAPAAFPEAGAG